MRHLCVTMHNNNFLKNNCVSIYYKMATGDYSCFQLAGAITAVIPALEEVGHSLEQLVEMKVVDYTRVVASDLGYYTYFIKLDTDINSLITYEASGTGDLNDDAYGFLGFTATASTKLTPDFNSMSLPSNANVEVSAGLIDANNVVTGSSYLSGTFPINLYISVNDQGSMSATIAVSGENVTASVVDNKLLAQQVYWDVLGVTVPTPAAISEDRLSATVSSAQITAHFAEALAAVRALYNPHEMLTSWSVNIPSFAKSNNNSLAQYARAINATAAGTTSANPTIVFGEGTRLMASTPFLYGVQIMDHLNELQTIVAQQNVYGVLVQKTPVA